MEMKFYVYLMTNSTNTVIYTGVTKNLIRRIWEHKNKVIEGFTKKYKITKLVYYEEYLTAYEAITREKQIKAGSRQKKIDLIKKNNSDFKDLYADLV